MIYGSNVGHKYGVIIDGRRAELYKGIPVQQHHTKYDEMEQFRQLIRECSPSEFEQWYQLYR